MATPEYSKEQVYGIMEQAAQSHGIPCDDFNRSSTKRRPRNEHIRPLYFHNREARRNADSSSAFLRLHVISRVVAVVRGRQDLFDAAPAV
jgi:hypothetical protein